MTSCLHARLIRQVGPLHENDNPPIYRCEECSEFFHAILVQAGVTVTYGPPPVPGTSRYFRGDGVEIFPTFPAVEVNPEETKGSK